MMAEKAREDVSPWGVQDMVTVVGQWTNSLISADAPIICGHPKQLVCAMRTTTVSNAANIGFRLLVEV